MQFNNPGSLLIKAAMVALTLASFLAVGQETVLHNFGGSDDGSGPTAPLVQDAAGHLYGTTTSGGKFSGGTVFELKRARNGNWTEKILHNFGKEKDGFWEYGGLILDASGNLYGTSLQGGAFDGGIVFELIRQPGGRWSEKILRNFGKGKDGLGPNASLIFDASGNLYGTTGSGGKFSSGTVFELSPQADGRWAEKILHHFASTNDGAFPVSRLVFDNNGHLFGTTLGGGTYSNCVENGIVGCGTAFELVPNGSGKWDEKILHNFDGTDGLNPFGGLTLSAPGNLFGTTQAGGISKGGCHLDNWGCGTVFELKRKPDDHWTMLTIYNFCSLQSCTDGDLPHGVDLVFDNAGALYGTASSGGSVNQGAVFKLVPNGNTWTEDILYSFQGGTDGSTPAAGVILGMDGKLFGTTIGDWSRNSGTAFALSRADFR